MQIDQVLDTRRYQYCELVLHFEANSLSLRLFFNHYLSVVSNGAVLTTDNGISRVGVIVGGMSTPR